jgi:hypothetical protein
MDDDRGGFETRPYGTGRSDVAADIAAGIARLARLVEQELAAEEAVRAELGALPRSRTEAEKTARTLANLTHTLHLLQRMRAGLPAETGPDDHDDMPRDNDEFRHALARRIEAWAASRIGRGDGAGDSAAGMVGEIQ